MTEPKVSAIGKYRIVELVGEGAMGVVYRAVDTVLDRTVAIKVMNEAIARQEDLRKRFLHEAQAAGSLQHPNVVCIYDLGEVDGHLFIAMEFVHGVDLERLIEMGEPLSLQTRLDIMIDVLTGLSYAHKHGIVHRDIKPANIRVAEDGRAKIMDFGVAHLASSSMTRTGSFLGTPSYMAPEQITEGKTTPATDIFAVGAVLYQVLSLMKPFDGPTMQNLFFKIITEKPRPIGELMPGLPPALDRIVQKAMAKDPADRYATALEMANELSGVRSKLSGPSYPASVSLSTSVATAIELSRKKQARMQRVAFAGGGALVAAALFAIAWSQSPPRPAPATPTASPPQTAQAPGPVMPTVERQSTTAQPSVIAVKQAATPAQRAVKPDKTPPPVREKRVEPTRTTTKPSQPIAAPISASVSAPTTTRIAPQDTPTAPPVVVARPVVSPPVQEAAPPAPATAADIAPTVEAYARAIESRDVGTVRRVNPGLTAEQQRRFEDFFQTARSINVTFRIVNFEASGGLANARLVGSFDYVAREGGKVESLPVSLAATLRHDANAWHIVSVR
ncbi:MAG: protein kinase domain-containing protein [Gemmatimonadaceae bacterium]